MWGTGGISLDSPLNFAMNLKLLKRKYSLTDNLGETCPMPLYGDRRLWLDTPGPDIPILREHMKKTLFSPSVETTAQLVLCAEASLKFLRTFVDAVTAQGSSLL